MKIVCIIYAISWLLLLAIYLYRRKEGTFNWKNSDSVEKFVLFIVILFAPVVVLILPFSLFSSIRGKKKTQKEAEERKREEELMLSRVLSQSYARIMA